jgi:phytol kinase
MNNPYNFKSDVLAASLILTYVLFWILLTEWLARSNKIRKEDARKILHVMAGNVIFFLPIFERHITAIIIPGLFIVGNYLLSPLSPIQKLRLKTFEAGHALGTVYYAIALTVLVIFFFDQPEVIFISFLPVAYGDGLAAAVGIRAKRGIFISVGGQKSLQGTLAMFVASLISVYLGLMLLNIQLSILISTLVALGATVLELLSPKGIDNLVISLGLSSLYYPFVVIPVIIMIG